MNTLEIVIILILIITILKIITPLINKATTFNDEKIKFKVKMKKESITNLTGIEFEYFCRWLFDDIYHYRDVIVTPSENDGGVDLILTDENFEKTYVECKRYTTTYDYKDDKKIKNYDFMIGREICQKLVGAMMSNGIKKGIIVTTGEIHPNADKYISDLNKNSDLNIKFITLHEIVKILDAYSESENYYINIEV
ncbi:hypothetical protein UT300003_05490 [Clostridium sardiniense]